MSNLPAPIVVTGDPCFDKFAWPVSRSNPVAADTGKAPENWELRDGLSMCSVPGGSWLMAELVQKATDRSDSNQPAANIKVLRQPIPDANDQRGSDRFLHSVMELKLFPASNSDKDRKDLTNRVWRVDRFRGFAEPESGQREHERITVIDDSETAQLVVLDDVGNGFRDHDALWPKALKCPTQDLLILWKLARPLWGGKLASHLLSNPAFAAHTIVVLSAKDLRKEGADISRQLCWERTAGDLIYTLKHDHKFFELRKAAHLVVRFDLEGVIHLANPGTAACEARLTYWRVFR